MKVVLLTSDSACQRALAHRLAALPQVELTGVIIQEIPSTRQKDAILGMVRHQPTTLISKVAQRVLLRKTLNEIASREITVFGTAGRPRPWPECRVTSVADINGPQSVSAVADAAPDLVAVSGTRIVRDPLFRLRPQIGLVNLHTGISPFYRGGPNCTLWCLANQEPQFIGSTIHWLDAGIDTGNLIRTEQTPLTGSEDLAEAVWRTVVLGHDMYAGVVAALAGGEAVGSVPQSQVGSGRTYLTREWNVVQLARAVRFVNRDGLRKWVLAGRPGTESVRLVP